MSQANHTLGPWVVSGHIVETAERHIPTEDGGDIGETMIACGIDNPADARLIAAAPNLLACAKRAEQSLARLPHMEWCQKSVDEGCSCSCGLTFALAEIRAAIARVTRESA